MTAAKFPVAEVFGPTIQGEGKFVGRPCYFVRFGACDYRCVWCDSMHAVLPEKVAKLPKLDAEEIVGKILRLKGDYNLVVLSGGNPAVWDLTSLISILHGHGYDASVETQGSVFKPWLNTVEHVTISPKPPSSQWTTTPSVVSEFIRNLTTDFIVKIVVFDAQDLEYALRIGRYLKKTQGIDKLYLSCGTDAKDTAESLAVRYQNLIVTALDKFGFENIDLTILPQLHVIAWGHQLGV